MSAADTKVVDALRQALGDDRFGAAAAAADLIAEGHLDSYTVLELTARLEDAYGIMIPPAQIGGDAYRSIGALKALCERLATA